jgi:hypothetical protein
MGWSLLVIGIVVGAAATFLRRRRRQQRLTLTQHSVRCPVNDCAASLGVHSDPAAYPSGRHVDVVACSLLPPTSFVPTSRKAYFPDMTPAEPYLDSVGQAPWHSADVACSKPCLFVLNAAERGARSDRLRCTSGVSDAMELARQTQRPALTRLMWFHHA